MIILKAFGIWLLMAAVAIGNGLVREDLLVRWLGRETALLVSGILLAVLVFVITYGCLPMFGRQRHSGYLGIGLFWAACTILFEFGFGHFVANKTWWKISQVFNCLHGNLFSLVILVTLFSPWLAARLRRKSFGNGSLAGKPK